jgi:hypothetical protein
LFPEFLEISLLAVKFSLVHVDLPLLFGLFLFLSLHLVADQGAGAEAERAADGRARAWVPDCRADDAADCGTSQGADSRPFLPSG